MADRGQLEAVTGEPLHCLTCSMSSHTVGKSSMMSWDGHTARLEGHVLQQKALFQRRQRKRLLGRPIRKQIIK